MRTRGGMAVMLAVGTFLAGCGQRTPELETRTYELRYLEDRVAHAMIEPYVWEARPEAPGRLTVVEGRLTVRETPENLTRIEQTLAEFDRPKPMVRLTFQIIEADGAADPDSVIRDVEEELRKLFRFEGYRLVDEVVVHGSEQSQVFQEMPPGELDDPWGIEALIADVRADSAGGSVEVSVRLLVGGSTVLGTTVRVRAGRTAVLGRTPARVGERTLILVVRPELIPASDA